MYDETVLASIRDAVHLHDLVEDHGVQLRRSGPAAWKGLCPFHDEKTPSFTIRDTIGRYHCFGCGESGDVYSFVMATEGFDFPEAVRHLAALAHITVPEPDSEDEGYQRRKRQRHALDTANTLYTGLLQNSPDAATARAELTRRGFTPTDASQADAGYAPHDLGTLMAALKRENVTITDAVDAGLLWRNDSTGALKPAFRGRLTFAIRDRSSNIIGFGARRLSDNDPLPGKYVNTRTTDLYRKSEALYGWDVAKQAATKNGRLLIMEGYTDVMAARAAGITEAVAPCGTAFTREQFDIIRKALPDQARFVFCMDGDQAGLKATFKAWETTIACAERVWAVTTPPDTDPCQVYTESGAEGIRTLLKGVRPLTRVVLDATLNQATSPETAATAAQHVADLLGKLPNRVLAHQYATLIADQLGAPLPEAHTTITPPTAQKSATTGGLDARASSPQPASQTGWGPSEPRLIHRLATDPEARTHIRTLTFPHQLLTPTAHQAWDILMAAPATETPAATLGRLHDALNPDVMTQLMAAQPLPGAPQDVLPDLADTMIRRDLDTQIQQATRQAREGMEGAYERWEELVAVRDSL